MGASFHQLRKKKVAADREEWFLLQLKNDVNAGVAV
jgi:hypothetical protein